MPASPPGRITSRPRSFWPGQWSSSLIVPLSRMSRQAHRAWFVPSQAATLREHDPLLVPHGHLKVAWGGMDQYPVGGGVGADPAACKRQAGRPGVREPEVPELVHRTSLPFGWALPGPPGGWRDVVTSRQGDRGAQRSIGAPTSEPHSVQDPS